MNFKKMHARLAVAALFAVPLVAAAQQPLTCQATSAKNRIALVELYTSEGCSSCPPADNWLSQVQASDQIIPIALHVDYWDYIGWKDPFADPRFTERQREISFRNRLNTIYTPQVVVDGRDFPNWWNARSFLASVKKVNSMTAPVQLQVSGQVGSGKQAETEVSVTVKPVAAGDGAPSVSGSRLHVAVFEDALVTDVERGENAGVTLKHDKVVRHWLTPVALTKQGSGSLKKTVKLPAGLQTSNAGIVAFAQAGNGDVIQAVSCQFKAGS